MLEKLVLSFLVCFAFFGGNVSVKTEASAVEDRATWLWNTSSITANPEETLAFLAEKRVNKLYLQVDQNIPVSAYKNFIQKAAAQGINVLALGGAPDWAAPAGYLHQDRLLNWLKTYQSSAAADEKFTGLHLDVEPYLYSGWKTNQADTIKAYQTLLMKAKSASSGLNIPLEADMPFWFDTVNYKNSYGKGMLAEWVIVQTSSVTIMAYRDSAAAIINIASTEVGLAGKYKKPLVIGVETGQTDEGSIITFSEEGEAYMEQQLAAVQAHWAFAAGFRGIAIHHVGSWQTLAP